MRKLTRVAAAGLGALACAAALTVPALTLTARPARAAGDCTPTAYKGPDGWVVGTPCPGSSGAGGGSGGTSDCDIRDKSQLGPAWHPPSKAPEGDIWLVVDCPGIYHSDSSFVNYVLVIDGGPLTTEALAQQAYAELAPPSFTIGTAPIPASGAVPVGVTGIPEWFWVPAGTYTPITKTVALAGASATVTATPGPLQITLGDGQTMTCQGPGTPYRQGDSPLASDCKYIYQQPSYNQPDSAYKVTVSVIWNATWKGTPAGGGTLPSITTTADTALTIDSAQADNTASP